MQSSSVEPSTASRRPTTPSGQTRHKNPTSDRPAELGRLRITTAEDAISRQLAAMREQRQVQAGHGTAVSTSKKAGAADIKAFEEAIRLEGSYWVDKLHTDPSFRLRLLHYIDRRQGFHAQLRQGQLSLSELHEQNNQLGTQALLTFELADAQGWTPETLRTTIVSGVAYASSSSNAFYWVIGPNIGRVAIALALQVAKACSPSGHMAIQAVQWTVNLVYVPLQLYCVVLGSVRNADSQSLAVARQAAHGPYFTLNAPSNKCETMEPGDKPLNRKLRSARAASRELSEVRQCIEAINSGEQLLWKRQHKHLKRELARQLGKIQMLADKHQERARARAQSGRLKAAERAVVDARDPMDVLQCMLAVKDTPLACSAASHKAISEALRLYRFYRGLVQQMQAAKPAPSGLVVVVDEESLDDPPPPTTVPLPPALPRDHTRAQAPDSSLLIGASVPEALADQYLELFHETFLLESFEKLNRQRNLGHSRAIRSGMQFLGTLLSFIPNVIALDKLYGGGPTQTAYDTEDSPLGFGYWMDVALLGVLVATPLLYSLTHDWYARHDMRAKQVAMSQVFNLISAGHFLDATGRLDEARLSASMKGLLSLQFEHLATALGADELGYQQELLAYAVDQRTLDEQEARRVKIVVEGQTLRVACTYRALAAAFSDCDSPTARLAFVLQLGMALGLDRETRASMRHILRMLEANKLDIQHAKKMNVAALLGEGSTLPEATREMLAGALVYAMLRFQMYLNKDLTARASDEFQQAQAHAMRLADAKGDAERRSLLTLFQIEQKLASTVIGSGLPVIVKALVVLASTLLEIKGHPLHHGTWLKATGSVVVLLSTLIGILQAYGNHMLIANKNGKRQDFTDRKLLNIFNTSLKSRHGHLLLSLDHLRGIVTQHDSLLAEPVPQAHQASPSQRIGTFIQRLLSDCLHKAEQAAPPSATVDLRALDDEAPEGSPSAPDSSDSASEPDEPPPVLRPIPRLPFDKPIAFGQDTWSQINAMDFRDLIHYARLPSNTLDEAELQRVLQDHLDQLEAQYLMGGGSSSEAGPSASSSSDSDPDADAQVPARAVMSALKSEGLLPAKDLLLSPKRRDQRINAAAQEFWQEPKARRRALRRERWQQQLAVLRQAIDTLDATHPQFPAHEQAHDMLEALLKRTRKAARPRQSLDGSTANTVRIPAEVRDAPDEPAPPSALPGAAGRATKPDVSPTRVAKRPKASTAQRAFQRALTELQSIGFLSTDALNSRERQRLIQHYLKQAAPGAKSEAERQRWRQAWRDTIALLISPPQVDASSQEQRSAWAQAARLLDEMLRLTAGPQAPGGQTAVPLATPGPDTLPTMDFNDVQALLNWAGLWSDQPLSPEEQQQRVAQLLTGGGISRSDWRSDHRRWSEVKTVLEQTLGFPRVQNDPGFALSVRQALRMSEQVLQRLTEPPSARPGRSPLQRVRLPGPLDTSSPDALQAQLLDWGLWHEEVLSSSRCEQLARERVAAWRAVPGFEAGTIAQHLDALLTRLIALRADTGLPTDWVLPLKQSIAITRHALKGLRPPRADQPRERNDTGRTPPLPPVRSSSLATRARGTVIAPRTASVQTGSDPQGLASAASHRPGVQPALQALGLWRDQAIEEADALFVADAFVNKQNALSHTELTALRERLDLLFQALEPTAFANAGTRQQARWTRTLLSAVIARLDERLRSLG